ncbi:hypothetical protein [Bathymodiolus japonicus methanotrophic gill symbiont]|uniref:hypothetical protein n=1 Tax=Bathymodiolus japonicus methanotrophic gill symbiont TaxID=113269 RepID=UPI001C8EECCD|nr:hypothetical protein [Bathymodiolus japonicus methanotrophic gill symbiont]
MFKLLDEALKVDDDLKEVKENDERYLVIDNNKLRARNKLLFEENKRLRDLTKTGVIK